MIEIKKIYAENNYEESHCIKDYANEFNSSDVIQKINLVVSFDLFR